MAVPAWLGSGSSGCGGHGICPPSFSGRQIGEKGQDLANALAGYRDGPAGPAVNWPRSGSRWQHEKAVCRLANAKAESMQDIFTPALPPHSAQSRSPYRELMPLRQLAEEIYPPRFLHGSDAMMRGWSGSLPREGRDSSHGGQLGAGALPPAGPRRPGAHRDPQRCGWVQQRRIFPSSCTARRVVYQAAIRSAGVKAASTWVVDVPERETAMSGTGSAVTRSRWCWRATRSRASNWPVSSHLTEPRNSNCLATGSRSAPTMSISMSLLRVQ